MKQYKLRRWGKNISCCSLFLVQPPKHQRSPLSVAQPGMKKQKVTDKKMQRMYNT